MNKIINNMNISYLSQGDGEFVFLLHGWGASSVLFERTMAALSVKYTVIAPDFPGFGGSDEPRTAWGMDEYTRFTVDFISSFNCEKVILLGHSFGGRVIIKMANLTGLPFEIEKIVLVDSAGVKPIKSTGVKLRIASYKLVKKILGLPPMRTLFPSAIENLRNRSGSSDYRAASPMMRDCFTKIVNEDLTPIFPGVKPPTLIIWGECDDATPLSDAKLMEAAIPDAGLVVIPHTGHYSFVEQPGYFIKVLKSFLEIREQ